MEKLKYCLAEKRSLPLVIETYCRDSFFCERALKLREMIINGLGVNRKLNIVDKRRELSNAFFIALLRIVRAHNLKISLIEFNRYLSG